MCGIAGFVFAPGVAPELASAATKLMSQQMRPRGPDAEALWQSDGVVLAHRRLAIVDLDARANQPMRSRDGRYSIVFNGEIYNFRELRHALVADGVVLSTESDTEVLLALFARDGEHALPQLRGMFAFAVWDAHAQELFLARDAYGIKPLYYAQTTQGFVFASQVRAVLASEQISPALEPAGVAGFYLWGYVPEPWTLQRGVLAVPSGHWLRLRPGGAPKLACWQDMLVHWRAPAPTSSCVMLTTLVRRALRDSVRAHCVSDVPISIFLSGGVDSAVLAGIASGLGVPVEGITLGFDEFSGQVADEVPRAAAIAAHYGLRHHVRRVGPDEFVADLPRILAAMDQPSIDGVNTWFVSKAAAERGYKVALSGVGGDELFCGYPSFQQIPQAAVLRTALTLPGVRALLRGPLRYLANARDQPKLAGIADFASSIEGLYFLRRGLFLPRELPGLMGEDMAAEGVARLSGALLGIERVAARDDVSAVGALESVNYLRNQLLRDADWASMAHSLELRAPLVDIQLLATLAPFAREFAGGSGKRMLAQAPPVALPQAIVTSPKTGFSTPMSHWLDASDAVDVLAAAVAGDPHATGARRWALRVGRHFGACA